MRQTKMRKSALPVKSGSSPDIGTNAVKCAATIFSSFVEDRTEFCPLKGEWTDDLLGNEVKI